MQKELSDKIETYMRHEHLMADMYQIFSLSHPEDAELWRELALEEENHAALIKAFESYFEPDIDTASEDLLAIDLPSLKEANLKLETLIKHCSESPLPRLDTFRIALELESSAGEFHYQNFLENSSQTRINSIFKELNGEEKDHARRIESYAHSLDLSLE